MACDPELVGKTYPQIVWVPEIERLKQFAAVTHDTCYAVDETMMQPMAIVLATVPFGVRQVVDDRELIVDPKRLTQLLHLGEDMQWARPIRVDEALSVHTTLRALETTVFGEILQIETILKSVDDVRSTPWAARCMTSLLIRERHPGAPRHVANVGTTLPAAQAREHFTLTWQVPEDQAERYAWISGDNNPIHLDDAAAQHAGLKGRVLHGLCTLSFAQRAICQGFLKHEGQRLGRLAARFKRPVYMRDTLELVGTLGEDHWIRFMVRNQNGQVVLDKGCAKIA